MGEAAAPCMMRSVSQPLFASCGFKEGDRLQALTTSVSFGRFMTEPLDWEKWSSFSHNRNLEDVQKYSRPGAVAEKKAFFEAYYKNFASKKEAKPHKIENKKLPKVLDIDENTNMENGMVDDIILSSCQVEQVKTSTENVSLSTSNLVSRNSGVKLEIVSKLDGTDLENGIVDGVMHTQVLDTRGVEPEISVKEQSRGVEPERSVKEPEIASNGNDEGIVLNASKVEPERSSHEDVIAGTNLVLSENVSADGMITSSRQMEDNVSSKKHQFQVEISNHVEKNKKRRIKDKALVTKAEICLVKSSNRKAPIAEMQHKKAAIDLMEKKKSVLRLSIKFPASVNKNINVQTLSRPKDRLIQQSLTRVSSVNGVKKKSQVLPIPENKRSKTVPHDSKQTVLKSLSTNLSIPSGIEKRFAFILSSPDPTAKSEFEGHSEALITSTKKPRSTTVFSSFKFQSDERAAKRKEFFQMVEGMGNTMKTEQSQLQPKLKEKDRSDNRKLLWASVQPAKQKPYTSETKQPSDIIQKVQSKVGKKNFIEINKKNLCRSMYCLASKKLHDTTLMLNK